MYRSTLPCTSLANTCKLFTLALVMVVEFQCGRLFSTRNNRVEEEEDKVGQATTAAFGLMNGSCELRVLGQVCYASACGLAATTQ